MSFTWGESETCETTWRTTLICMTHCQHERVPSEDSANAGTYGSAYQTHGKGEATNFIYDTGKDYIIEKLPKRKYLRHSNNYSMITKPFAIPCFRICNKIFPMRKMQQNCTTIRGKFINSKEIFLFDNRNHLRYTGCCYYLTNTIVITSVHITLLSQNKVEY